jgi:peptidoglycan hydrolase-like protein with peptidoglycan-binding domain
MLKQVLTVLLISTLLALDIAHAQTESLTSKIDSFCSEVDTPIPYGAMNKDVAYLQAILSGYYKYKIAPTGYFGPVTFNIIKLIQQDIGIYNPSGSLGPITLDVIRKALCSPRTYAESLLLEVPSTSSKLPAVSFVQPAQMSVPQAIIVGKAAPASTTEDSEKILSADTALQAGTYFVVIDASKLIGVDPSGLKDSTNGIIRAIGNGNRKVNFSCGTYLISSTITLPSNTEIAGSDKKCVIFKADPNIKQNTLWSYYMAGVSGKNIFTNRDFIRGNTNIYIHDVTLDASSVYMHLASFVRSSNIKISRVNFYGGNGAPSNDGVSFIKSNNYTVEDSECSNVYNACYDQWDGSHDFTIRNNTVNGLGVLLHGILINGISSENSLSSAVANTSYNGFIHNNLVSNVKSEGISAYGLCSDRTPDVCGDVNNITISSNTIDTVSEPKTGRSYFGILVDGKNMIVKDNLVKNTYQSGIWVGRAKTNTDSVSITDNKIFNSNMGASSTTQPTYTDAITVAHSTNNVIIKNNDITGSLHRYAISVGASSTNTTICTGKMDIGTKGTILDLGKNSIYPCVVSNTIGYISKVSTGDGVANGWAFDRAASTSNVLIRFYLDGLPESGGILIGSTTANTVFKQVNWDYGIDGDHGFYFRIPDSLRDNKPHTLYVYPVGMDGNLGKAINPTDGIPFTISSSTAVGSAPVTDGSCLDPNSRCPSVGNNYLSPNYPTTSGWGDGRNYFNEWQCKSTAGYNYIARLNILPLGTFGSFLQKDSLDSSWGFDMADGNPILYFVTASEDFTAKWSLKKAIFNKITTSWDVFSVFDNPVKGGVSSQNGRSGYYVMNDYGQPGWGPVSTVPGSDNKIPGVSNVSVSKQIPSYPLVGKGPLGITAISSTLWPSTVSGGPEGRTCIHMNPKLLDYDSNGIPHTLIVNLWQNTTMQACKLPVGAPIAQLSEPGNYIYRYQGSDLGWQLDLDYGKVVDSSHIDTTNSLKQVPKLAAGTDHGLLIANWDGTVSYVDMEKPKDNNSEILLDCSASGVHFGEVAGKRNSIFFLGVKPDIASERTKYGLSNLVLPGDIYYAFTK